MRGLAAAASAAVTSGAVTSGAVTSAAQQYAAFLPADRRAAAAALEPERTWWEWEGTRVHVARARRPTAPVRLLVVHGAGGYSEALWPLAALTAAAGLDVAAPDLPLYGSTTTPDPQGIRYQDWVRLLVDLVAAEDDGRPLLLLGASMGGMLAHEVAARSGRVHAVAATCLLDPRDRRVRARLTRFGPAGAHAGPLLTLAARVAGRRTVPMRWVADMARMSRDPGLSALCARDRRGGGARVPVGFLASFLAYRHTPPEAASTPVLLVHPSHDDWTPPELSLRFLARSAAPSQVVLLRQGGHFPVEEPALTDLMTAITDLAARAARGHDLPRVSPQRSTPS